MPLIPRAGRFANHHAVLLVTLILQMKPFGKLTEIVGNLLFVMRRTRNLVQFLEDAKNTFYSIHTHRNFFYCIYFVLPIHQALEEGGEFFGHLFMLAHGGMLMGAIAQRTVGRGEIEAIDFVVATSFGIGHCIVFSLF